MNCNETRELLSLYIDNNLEQEQIAEIEKHLLVCDACKKEFEEILLVVNTMKNLPEIEIPAQFDSRLREELKKVTEITRRKTKRKKYIRYSSIAAIFCVGIFSIAMYNNINSADQKMMEKSSPSQNMIEESSPEQDVMKMMAEPNPKELDQAMKDYIIQLDELYKEQPYVLLDWTVESTQIYIIRINVEYISETGDVSYKEISFRGESGKLWKIE